MGPQWPLSLPHVYAGCLTSQEAQRQVQESEDNTDLSTAFPAEMCESERARPFTFLTSPGFWPFPYKYYIYRLSVFPLSLFIKLLLQIYGPPPMNEVFATYLTLTKSCNDDEKHYISGTFITRV